MKIPPKTLALVFRTALGLALLIGAGWLTWYLIDTKPQVSTSGLESQPVRVQVLRLEPVEVARQWRGYGTTQAKDSADVPARVGATVSEVPDAIEVGRVVRAGQVLARLDATDFSQALRAAEKRIAEADALIAQLAVEEKRLKERRSIEARDTELARTEYQRQVRRFEQGSATQSDVDRAQRTLLTAERALLTTNQQLDAIAPRRAGLEATRGVALADRDTARANLQRTVITSPIDGIIESLDVEVGENLAPGARVARIIDPRRIELPLQLPATARCFINVGNPVRITTRNHPDDCPPWRAQVARIGVVNAPTRTFTVFAEVDQSQVSLQSFAEGGGPYKLAAGAFALARLDTAEPRRRVVLPTRSIQEGRIRTVRDGKVVSRPVEVAFEVENTFEQLGVPDTQWVVLKDPPPTGTLVVLSASITILDGQPVEPVIANPAEQAKHADPDAAPGTALAGPDEPAGGGPR